MIQWFIRGNVPSLKNGKVWTGKFLVSAPSIRRWQKISKGDWELQKTSFLQYLTLVRRPYFIHLTFIRNRDNYWDFTAPVETIADEMVRQGWLNDDNIYEFFPLPGKPSIDRVNPGTIIRILKEPPKYEFL